MFLPKFEHPVTTVFILRGFQETHNLTNVPWSQAYKGLPVHIAQVYLDSLPPVNGSKCLIYLHLLLHHASLLQAEKCFNKGKRKAFYCKMGNMETEEKKGNSKIDRVCFQHPFQASFKAMLGCMQERHVLIQHFPSSMLPVESSASCFVY